MSSEVVFSVSGMTCGACSASITKALSETDGVKDASVSLLIEEAKVTFDDSKTSIQALKEVIEDCGFDADIKSHVNKAALVASTAIVDSLERKDATEKLTDVLQSMKGVNQVSLLIPERAVTCLHSTHVTLDSIKRKIEVCGFEVLSINSNAEQNADAATITKCSIQGMTCAACSSSITRALEDISGVISCNVSLVLEEAVVKHRHSVTTDQIKDAIEDCGFDCQVLSSGAENDDQGKEMDEDEVSLQIFGISNTTDLVELQYNIEALVKSLDGVSHFQLALKGNSYDSTEPLVTESNSSNVQAVRSQDNQELYEDENLIDELSVTFNPLRLGIRTLVDQLNQIEEGIYFSIVNSIDQSSTSQLRILSRVKDIQYWKSNTWKAFLIGIPIMLMSATQNMKLWSNIIIFPGLFLVSLLQLLLTSIVQFKLGSVFLKKFRQFLVNGGKNASMDVLVYISTSISFIFSVLSIVLSVWSGQTKKPPKVLFDTNTMIIFFISFGKYLENKAKGATSTALSRLLSLTPSTCLIALDVDTYEKAVRSQNAEKDTVFGIADFPTRTISIDLIQTNDIAIVLPGGKIPADGVIIYGESDIDESLLTGEPLPVFKKVGNSVIGGSLNGNKLIHIKVLRSGKRSQLQQIINLVRDSQTNRAPVQRFADFVAAKFVPTILVLSVITFLFWMLFCYSVDDLPKAFKMEDYGKAFVCLKLSISVIVVACPCALGLAAPTAIMVGTGVGASNGVLIKGGDVLEKAKDINVILFDKTGTLTTGDMKISNSNQIPSNNLNHADWWSMVGSVEANSDHPVGRAISRGAKEKLGLNFEEDTFKATVSEFKVFTGSGVSATVELHTTQIDKLHVSIGNVKMLRDMFPDLYLEFLNHFVGNTSESSNTIAHVVVNETYAGYIELSDSLKSDAKDVVNYLRYHERYIVGMVTGDHQKAALRISEELGIPSGNVFSEVTPIDKNKIIKDMKLRFGNQGNIGIAFVGDGINDAPALAEADIGMAISSGTDIAMETADIVLLGGNQFRSDLFGVPFALDISNATFRRVKANFVWAALYNMLMLPFAMGCFIPFNIILPPIAASAAMALSSVSVVVSSLLLKFWKPPVIKEDVSALERNIGHDEVSNFSLQSSTLSEFNSTKRNNDLRFKLFKKIRGSIKRDPGYELVPNN
ncbi:uncharacterized protein PRCAT00000966001 [Priceomyces carsonii]|uniref:uncharacterized protein n=1 Tax=Priceomyces carsonii TaxID=28549 RepID=UPI002ED8214C|nr:unnamed protein product [Priceomyces carsonii]